MQVFLPYPDIQKSVQCLDYRRLGKQRVEAKQILNILEGKTNSNAWRNHPAVRMFRGYSNCLGVYYNSTIDEWVKRGYRNAMIKQEISYPIEFPKWWGDNKFHSTHRSKLLLKDPEFYSKYEWPEPSNLDYYWPVKL